MSPASACSHADRLAPGSAQSRAKNGRLRAGSMASSASPGVRVSSSSSRPPSSRSCSGAFAASNASSTCRAAFRRSSSAGAVRKNASAASRCGSAFCSPAARAWKAPHANRARIARLEHACDLDRARRGGTRLLRKHPRAEHEHEHGREHGRGASGDLHARERAHACVGSAGGGSPCGSARPPTLGAATVHAELILETLLLEARHRLRLELAG
jgi:hypothetical protein